MDGSTGAAQTINANSMNYDIPSNLGTTIGSNLFHSFKTFNVEVGHSATFHGSSQLQNIINRVTGGESSTINGLIKSQGTNADFYFINPAGFIFGQGSSLDLGGSLHVSTADHIKLGENGIYSATNPEQSILVSEPPSAFGFVNNEPGNIKLENSSLQVSDGKQISLIGGDVEVTSSLLEARDGRVNLIADKQSNDISLSEIQNNQTDTRATGSLELKDNTTINTGWFSGGTIFIRSGKFELDNSKADVSTLDLPLDSMEKAGGDIHINASDLNFKEGAELNAASYNSKKGGSINIDTKNAVIENTSLNASSVALGDGGNINIQAQSIRLENNSNIQIQTYDQGPGGQLQITADNVVIKGSETIITADAAYPKIGNPNSNGTGKGGDISIQSNQLELSEGSNISAGTWGAADSGSINLNSNDISMDNAYLSVASRRGNGRGGDLNLKADNQLIVKNGASISSYTWEDGAPGSVVIEANELIVDGTSAQSSINGETYGSQNGANLIISGSSLTLSNGAKITSSSKGSGNAGDIDLQFDNITVNSNAQIASRSFESGDGGDIKIQSDSLVLSDQGEISSEVLESAAGGKIDIKATNISMTDGRIFGDTGGSGKAADLNITANTITMQKGSQISSTTVGLGKGGEINIQVEDTLDISGTAKFDISELEQALIEKRDGTQAIAIERNQETTIDQEITNLQNRQRTESAADAQATQIEIDNKFIQRQDIIANILNTEQQANQKRSQFHGLMLGSAGVGDSGNLMIEAAKVRLANAAGLTAASMDAGKSGAITIKTPALLIDTGASISGTSFGAGDGGKIEVKSQEIQLSNAAYIQSESHGDGEAGNIALIDADKIKLLNNSRVSTLARESDGGNIEIKAISLVQIDHSELTAEVRSGLGNGGNIDIDPEYVILNDGRIIANAYGGNGGNIKIVAQTFLGTPETVISASSQLGLDGVVEIDAPQIDLSSSLLDLALKFIDSESLVPRLCLPAHFEQRNSFQVTRQKWLPPSASQSFWNLP